MLIKGPHRWNLPLLTGWVAAGLCPGVFGQSVQLEIQLNSDPELFVSGSNGVVVQVQWSDTLADSKRWFHLDHVILDGDTTAVAAPNTGGPDAGYFRAVEAPSTNVVLVSGGSFLMGDSLNEGLAEERPVHAVRMDSFWMDRVEVTKELWDEVRLWGVANGYVLGGGVAKDTNHPVVNVNWYDAVRWCNARSEREGFVPAYYTDSHQTNVVRSQSIDLTAESVKWNTGYRLATEAEWEMAARGGFVGLRFPDGNTISQDLANYKSRSTSFAYDLSAAPGLHPLFNTGSAPYTSPVAFFPANRYGLYDMVGNAAEWCWDWHSATWYSDPEATLANTRGPSAGFSRVRRGVPWSDAANVHAARCAWREGKQNPGSGSSDLGLRCVLPVGGF